MDLDEVADRLYGLPPGEFTAARTEREKAARAGGDRALAARIHALRRPTLAAWAANQLARTGSARAQRLPVLGAELRTAYRDLDGGRIRALSAELRQLIPVLVGEAARLAEGSGHPLGADARREVEQTLHAVIADEAAGGRWIRGRLERPLTATGLAAVAAPADGAGSPRGSGSPGGSGGAGGEVVELGAAAARRDASARPARTGSRRADGAGSRGTGARGDEAARALRDSTEARAAAERELAEAQQAVRAAERRIAELSSELDRAGRDQQAAKARARAARRELVRADRAVQAAHRRAGHRPRG